MLQYSNRRVFKKSSKIISKFHKFCGKLLNHIVTDCIEESRSNLSDYQLFDNFSDRIILAILFNNRSYYKLVSELSEHF